MTKVRPIVVATRASALAQAQTDLALAALGSRVFSASKLLITTQGDKQLETPLLEVGGKGLFIKELEVALLDHSADLAIHSLKDMPLKSHSLLTNCVYLGGALPFDALVSDYPSLMALPDGACVGTSSLRRATQVKLLRPDLNIKLLRGNILTRLTKLEQGGYDAIILAAAGLQRLNIDTQYSIFSPEEMTPAFNQGIIVIQSRAQDHELIDLIVDITDRIVLTRMLWERAIAERFNATCESSFGVYAEVIDLELLKVNIIVFAFHSFSCWQRKSGIFHKLEDALFWLEQEFFNKGIDWSVCQHSFF